MLCKLKSCRKCHGDLVLDGDEWRCWQCGQYYYPNPQLGEPPPGPDDVDRPPVLVNGDKPRLLARRKRATRDINSRIAARHRSDLQWWRRNREIIHYLDEGHTVREISSLIGREQRQVRVVRERLNDLRS